MPQKNKKGRNTGSESTPTSASTEHNASSLTPFSSAASPQQPPINPKTYSKHKMAAAALLGLFGVVAGASAGSRRSESNVQSPVVPNATYNSTSAPTLSPSLDVTAKPTPHKRRPKKKKTKIPTTGPSSAPTFMPSQEPTQAATNAPTQTITNAPIASTQAPTSQPPVCEGQFANDGQYDSSYFNGPKFSMGGSDEATFVFTDVTPDIQFQLMVQLAQGTIGDIINNPRWSPGVSIENGSSVTITINNPPNNQGNTPSVILSLLWKAPDGSETRNDLTYTPNPQNLVPKFGQEIQIYPFQGSACISLQRPERRLSPKV